MTRAEDRALEWWAQAQTEARARLERLDRGEAWAPPSTVRCLRVFVDGPRPVDVEAERARAKVSQAEWRQLIAHWGAGGLLNALDDLGKRSGDATPPSVVDACWRCAGCWTR